MRRPVKDLREGEDALAFPDNDWVTDYPQLVEQLTVIRWDDGSAREPAQLSLKVQDGLILAAVSDKELERGLYRTGATVLEAVGALERALASGRADWRPWRAIRGGKK